MVTIQLLLTDEANRRALGSLVEQRHTPITDTDLTDADLYLVDDASFPQYRDGLEARTQEQDPVFCPVVLIRRAQTPITVDLPSPDADEQPLIVNEVVAAPVDSQVLFRRISNLVGRRQQTAELHEKNRQLEQFTSMLRHELRNPLSILDGYLDMARNRGDVESFEKCQAAIDRMERLFDQTLLIVQDEEINIDTKMVDLSTICSECWDIVSDSDAQLEIDTTRQIIADEDRLRQLLGNLFRNAVEHGGSDVTVTVSNLDDGFYVADDGVGIPEEDRDAVFESGYSTSHTGTGFGLEVVQKVADAHEWDLEIADGSGGGTRFEITGVTTK